MAKVRINNLSNSHTENRSRVIETARKVLRIESQAIEALVDRIDSEFERAVNLIYESSGRVIISGIGKSGIIAQKISATLTSTGTSAIFLHPAEGVHGDLGMVRKNDVVICISKSGNTNEISRLIPVFKQIGVPIIAMIGNLRSSLAVRCDVVLDVSVHEEACPNNLAPTASTTATLALGDALAVALLEKRNFNANDFAFLHPGGSLGRQLLKIEDVMFTDSKLPVVHTNATMRKVILEMTKKRFGGTSVIDDSGKLAGIITDGDLRRLMHKSDDLARLHARDIMNPHPKTVKIGCLANEAWTLMENHNIMQVIVVNEEGCPVGMVHLHDLLETGINKS